MTRDNPVWRAPLMRDGGRQVGAAARSSARRARTTSKDELRRLIVLHIAQTYMNGRSYARFRVDIPYPPDFLSLRRLPMLVKKSAERMA
jgi:hypothetical protein